ncbi:hypothetical protein FA13DRAFT_1800833 [Coprinellus micaceus]|uniref:Uncharacterized protein n=1 Tax=Coprinellus micaceus TaxID=71717 RepID=A0A4Y7SG64_COPMI|nr:hypothetical protein FA13DRAFT_1800833 [Coprinellus micaceus]
MIQECIKRTEKSIDLFSQSGRSGPGFMAGGNSGFPSSGDAARTRSQTPSDAMDGVLPSEPDPQPKDGESPLLFMENSIGESLDFDELDTDERQLGPKTVIKGFQEEDTFSEDSNNGGSEESESDSEGDSSDANITDLANSHTDDLLFESAFFDPPPSVQKLQENLLGGYEPPPQPPPSPFELEPLTEEEKLSLRHYIAWRRTNGTVRAYKEHAEVLQDASGIEILSLYNIRELAVRLACLSPQKVDMCPKSCIVYTGPYANKLACPFVHGKDGVCGMPRYCEKGRKVPITQFTVLPVIPSIQALFANAETS